MNECHQDRKQRAASRPAWPGTNHGGAGSEAELRCRFDRLFRKEQTMSTANILRAWKDQDYRSSLSAEELSALPEHPAGVSQLFDEHRSIPRRSWTSSGRNSMTTWASC